MTSFRGEQTRLFQDIREVKKGLTWQKNIGWYGIAVFYTLGLIIFSWWAILLKSKENEFIEDKKASMAIIKRAKAFNPRLDSAQNSNILDFVSKPKIFDLYSHPDKYTFISVTDLKDLRREVKYLKGKSKSAEVNKTDSVSH